MSTVAVTNTEFLEAMFEGLPDDAAAMVCSLPGDPYAAHRGAWFARPWTFGATPPAHPGWNNYVSIGAVHVDPVLGQYRRRKANFARLLAVMVDDLGTKVAMHHLERLPPSALIETSPDNFQAFYFLKPCAITDNVERATQLIDVIIKEGLAASVDPGMAGCVRLGRLPCGTNGKAKYLRDGRPFHVCLVRWSPETRYSVKDVAQAFKLDLTPPQPRPTASTVSPQVAHARIDDFGRLVEALSAHGLYQSPLGRGRHSIVCPWSNEHSDRAGTGTAIFEPGVENKWAGGFCCWHGHCAERGIGDLYKFARALRRGAA